MKSATLLCVFVASTLLAAITARAADLSGKYENPKISLELKSDAGAYTGQINLADQHFPLKAHEESGKLQGTFTSQGTQYNFTATPTADGLTLITDNTTYTLKKIVGNPLDQPQTPVTTSDAPPSDFTVVNTTDTGRALSAQKPKAASVRAALESALPDLAKYLGAQPVITKAFEDSKTHKSGGASFTAKTNDRPLKGFISCNVSDAGATVAVIYAAADAPAAEWNKLAGTPPKPEAAADKPAEIQLKEYKFADGTGVMGIADGWKTAAQSAMGEVVIEGPADQVLSLGSMVTVATPAAAIRGAQLYVAPYTNPAETFAALIPQFSANSQRRGGPALKIDNLVEKRKAKPMLQNGQSSILSYGITRTFRGEEKHYLAAAQVEIDPVGQGSFMCTSMQARAPDKSFEADLPIMLAMARSVRLNDEVIRDKTRQNLDTQNRNFAIQQQIHREVTDAFDKQLRNTEKNQTRQLRSITDFDEVIRGYRTVEDTKTGEKTSVDLGNVDQIVDHLNRYDPDRYRQIPLRDETYPLK